MYELKGLVFASGIQSDDVVESVHVCGDVVLFGGEETELFAWKMGSDQVKIIKHGTESGVMKILGW